MPTYINDAQIAYHQENNESQATVKYTTTQVTEEIGAQSVTVNYQLAAATEAAASDAIGAAARPWRFYLADVGPVVPGSVILDVAGALWFDDGEGRLLRNYSPVTRTGTPQGTIDYESTEVLIEDYAGRPNTATIHPSRPPFIREGLGASLPADKNSRKPRPGATSQPKGASPVSPRD